MGESRGGEGRAVGPTVIMGAAAILNELLATKYEVGALEIQRVSSNLYSFKIRQHGYQDDEIGFISIPDDIHPELTIPPKGGSMAKRGGR